MRSLAYRFLRRVICVAVLTGGATLAQAVTIDWVTIGNPGNAGELSGAGAGGYGPDATVGGVAYNYQISKYEITNSQYVEFLNAKATLQDPGSPSNDLLWLYNSGMSSDAISGGINRTGTGTSVDPFVYTVQTGEGNYPVTFVNWYDSIRFANWMHNSQGSGSTETGAYTLGTLGANAIPTAGLSITRNAGAKVFLTSENEWYKAAYYNGGAGTYVDYPTGTSVEPNSDQPPGDVSIQSNVGNFVRDDGSSNGYNDGYAVSGSTVFPTGNALTDVGAYSGAPSLYGTFDQGGNVLEWNEALISGSFRGYRGGSWNLSSIALAASNRNHYDFPTDELGYVGFRLATVPEPTSSAIAVSAAVAFWWLRRRRS